MAVILQFLKILGSLGVFFYGMKILSESIQRLTGERLRASLGVMTKNRLSGIFTGFFITSVVQSSSATTVMIVSFVNAKIISLRQSIGVIMGANLGTTLTFWMVAFFGFKFSISTLVLPVIGIALPMLFSKNSKTKNIGEALMGFGFLFMGLGLLKKAVPDIKSNPEVLSFLADYANMGYTSYILFVIVGIILTVVVQSSSAAGAITAAMAFKGWIDYPTAAAIVLGENIGTTITAYLASLGKNVYARRAARAHFLLNAIGVGWLLVVFVPFVQFVDHIIPGLSSDPNNIPIHMAGFHSLFNLLNICLLFPFVSNITKLVERLVTPKEGEEEVEYKLEYLSNRYLDTPDVMLIESKQEIVKLADIARQMFSDFQEVYFHPEQKMGNIVEQLKQKEDLTDIMAEEITNFLIECSKSEVTSETIKAINAQIRIVDELESIADCCYSLILIAQKRHETTVEIKEETFEEIKSFAVQVEEFMDLNQGHLSQKTKFNESNLNTAFELETGIDETRHRLRQSSTTRIQEDGNVKSELLFMDVLKNFERIGDYSLNISQALRSIRGN